MHSWICYLDEAAAQVPVCLGQREEAQDPRPVTLYLKEEWSLLRM